MVGRHFDKAYSRLTTWCFKFKKIHHRFRSYDRLIFHASADAGESKNQYQTALLKEILAKLGQKTNKDLVSVLNQNLNSQHMILSQFGDEEQTTFNSLLWSGSILKPSCPNLFANNTCQVDALAQVEANVGVNKANYFLKREINHQITLETGKASHQREVYYTNLAKTNTWPRGEYKAHIQFFLPATAINIKVQFVDKVVPIEIKKKPSLVTTERSEAICRIEPTTNKKSRHCEPKAWQSQ